MEQLYNKLPRQIIHRDVIEGYGEVTAVTAEEKKAVSYVMQSIEILFVAFFLNEGNVADAMSAKNIYAMLIRIF